MVEIQALMSINGQLNEAVERADELRLEEQTAFLKQIADLQTNLDSALQNNQVCFILINIMIFMYGMLPKQLLGSEKALLLSDIVDAKQDITALSCQLQACRQENEAMQAQFSAQKELLVEVEGSANSTVNHIEEIEANMKKQLQEWSSRLAKTENELVYCKQEKEMMLKTVKDLTQVRHSFNVEYFLFDSHFTYRRLL
jgi:hypothetical protein